MSAISPGFDVRPLTPVIGAEISGIDLRQPLSRETVVALEQAIHPWRGLFFRDQNSAVQCSRLIRGREGM